MNLTDDRDQNIRNLRAAVEKVYKGRPIEGTLCLVQGVHESRLLGKPTQLAVKYNNLFGIKGKGITGKSVMLPTWEEINGKVVQVKAAFSHNDSLEDSVRQHFNLIRRPRYKRVRDAKSVDEAFDMILKCGYATDSKYVQKLHQVHNIIKDIV